MGTHMSQDDVLVVTDRLSGVRNRQNRTWTSGMKRGLGGVSGPLLLVADAHHSFRHLALSVPSSDHCSTAWTLLSELCTHLRGWPRPLDAKTRR